MSRITRLSFEDRLYIEESLKKNLPYSRIAIEMKRCPSSIRYEVIKGGGPQNYTAETAQKLVNQWNPRKMNKTHCQNEDLNSLFDRVTVADQKNLEQLVEVLTPSLLDIIINVSHIYRSIKEHGIKSPYFED